ncbi:hypothetical protein D9V29_10445 [Mycetocola manganoxydans]|uniref:2-oxoglutarate dehydrogenase n=1 Tax=Mycetocola manganoxydans TaxID=699879 RepID=A0A3L6ZR08_9MICO|nr:DUF6049 family protein [Mycetocola manganoxydans]RLP70209.1 hypothetical protein D9V29_10445 [Mycetocola manganoxydans]GHD49284.1 hypothetical protein GCM10008097_21970 [Mycetocola manganoxydans]
MTKNRLPKTLRALVATAVGLVSLGIGTGAAAVESAPAVTLSPASMAVAEDDVTVDISQSAGFLTGASALTLTVTVENSTEAELVAGTLAIQSGVRAIESRTELTDWLAGTGKTRSDRAVTTVAVPALGPGVRHTATPITISADILGLPDQAGAYPLDAQYTADATVVNAPETIVFTPDATDRPLGVAVAAPITAPPGSTGLLSADALAQHTLPAGVLTRQLDGLIDRPVALGIDPMIIASIRALGSAAPASAVNWLDRLSRATNETFPLQFADADASVQAQAGLAGLLNPTSLLYSLNPENFTEPVTPDDETTPTDPLATEDPQGTPDPTDPTATPSPTPEPGEPTLPTLAELTEWPYTTTGVVWPDRDTVRAADLPVFSASGATTTIVSSSNVTTEKGYTPGAAGTAGDASVLVTDAVASAALQRAATAGTTEQQLDALADLAGQLMVIASEEDAPARTLLLTLDREWPPTGSRLSDAITALSAMPTVSSTALSAAGAQRAEAVAIADAPQSPERIALVKRLTTREANLASFSTMLAEPALLTGRERAEILALLAVSWRDDNDGWTAAASAHDTQTTTTLESVSIAATSPILMVSNQSSLPFSVRNELDYPVTVVLQASSSSLKLNVNSSVTQEIPANARETVRVPVEARLGNGEVTVQLQLYSPQSAVIGESALVPVTVRADWEGIGAAILVVLVSLLFIGGLIRTVRKRRSDPRAASETTDSDAPATADDTGKR